MKKFKVGKTTYQRSNKFGVGKEIGGKIYVHRKYANMIMPIDVLYEAISLLPTGFIYNCLMFDSKKPGVIRFDEAPDFDTAREPHPGNFVEVNINTREIRHGHSNMIWHHKWMWVADDYDGFDVNESYEWSKKWTQVITHPSGSKRVWEQQLNENELR